MSDEQRHLPGLGPPVERSGRRTLRDLVDSHSPNRTSHMETLLASGDAPSAGNLRLGFPSSAQLAGFVSGQHGRLFDGLGLPSPLRHVGGGHLERKRFFSAGRVSSPDLLLVGPEGEQILTFTCSPLTLDSRLPDIHSLELVAGLGHEVHGVLVTPIATSDVEERVSEHIARFVEPRMHWVRYRIDMEIL